jgi:hypothetical protein
MLFKPTTPDLSLTTSNWMLYGDSKIGKTTLASRLIRSGKPPLFIATEDGTKALSVSVKRCYDWEQLMKFVGEMEPHADEIRQQHSCFIIDLLSDVQDWAADYLSLNHAELDDIEDLKYGGGTRKILKLLKPLHQRLTKVLPVVYLCHCKDRKVQWKGADVNMMTPGISPSISKWYEGKVDIIAYLHLISAEDKDKHADLYLKPTILAVAGSRFPTLVDVYPVPKNDPDHVISAINNRMSQITEESK